MPVNPSNTVPEYYPGQEIDAEQISRDIGSKVDAAGGAADSLTLTNTALDNCTITLNGTAVALGDIISGKAPQALVGALVDAFMTAWVQNLSQTQPSSGWWSDAGSPTFTGVPFIPASTVRLAPVALAESMQDLYGVLPAMGSDTNFHGLQKNAGVATVVDDGT